MIVNPATPLLTKHISSTLDRLVEQFSNLKYRGCQVEAWVFDDHKRRQAAQILLQQRGVQAYIYSAYKPLLHYFLETAELSGHQFERVEIIYPVSQHASPRRFLLEAYPLAALIKSDNVIFRPDPHCFLCYQIRTLSTSGEQNTYVIDAPNRLTLSATGETQLSPTGMVKVYDPQGKVIQHHAVVTDYEQVFSTVLDAIKKYSWPISSPYFEQLLVRIEMPVTDEPIGYGQEVVSLKEALHEDLYFSIQEWFKFHEGKAIEDRSSQPGQIIPQMVTGEHSEYRLSVSHQPYNFSTPQIKHQILDLAESPVSIEQVEDELGQIEGRPLDATTYAGTVVRAKYRYGTDKPVMISGGQHANETTGIIGALRASLALSKLDTAHFAVSPLENPDGYALQLQLIEENPYHIHHAARYTALGDDLGHRQGTTDEELLEKSLRVKMKEASGAQLHINLHGYPSHEWTRPLSGYVPAGFDRWTIPKGFFLIIQHHDSEEWRDYAERFIHEITLVIGSVPSIKEFNRRQAELYRIHAGETNFKMVNGFPCIVTAVTAADLPLTLITEYPDETIYGQGFLAGHEIQMTTVLAAYRAHQKLSL